MRYSHLAIAAVVFASTATGLKAQYPRALAQVRPPVYYYVAPSRPVYVQNIYAAPRYVRQPNPTGFQNRPYYGAYGYGNYSNGSTDGFPPFRGRRYR
jgi:hypothetical protein